MDRYWGDETQGGRRKYYRITDAGRAVLVVPLSALGCLFAAVALRRDHPRLALVGVVGGMLTLALFATFMTTFDANGAGGNAGIAGLVQRALILVAMITQSVLVVGVFRRAQVS